MAKRKPKKLAPAKKQPESMTELRQALTKQKKAELVDVLLELAQADRGILRQLTARFEVAAAQDELLAATRQAIADATDFDERDINDVFSFRICIETFAVRQALPLMTENDHAELVAIVDAMIAAADDDDVSSVQDKDLLLHRRICEMSCNNQTIRAHEGINTEVQMLIASVKLDQESLAETAHAHIGIVRAIATKRVDVTVGAIEKHIETTWSYVLSAYRAAALAAQDQEYHEPSRGSHGTPLKASVIGGR